MQKTANSTTANRRLLDTLFLSTAVHGLVHCPLVLACRHAAVGDVAARRFKLAPPSSNRDNAKFAVVRATLEKRSPCWGMRPRPCYSTAPENGHILIPLAHSSKRAVNAFAGHGDFSAYERAWRKARGRLEDNDGRRHPLLVAQIASRVAHEPEASPYVLAVAALCSAKMSGPTPAPWVEDCAAVKRAPSPSPRRWRHVGAERCCALGRAGPAAGDGC